MKLRQFYIFLAALFCVVALKAQVQFQSSNLPIIVITTENGEEIQNEPKMAAHVGIIWNGDGATNHITDPFNDYDGKAGVEIRGSSSQYFPKQNFALETWNADSSSNNVSLLGFPKENDWILHGPFSDKSLMRNAIAYTMAGWIMEYAPRVRFCELVINGDYRGVYILTEKIKRDKNRVNISELTPDITSGDELTGGYILKFDKSDGAFSDGFPSLYLPYPGSDGPVYYQYHYPKPDEVTPAQKVYIKNYIHEMEYALNSPDFADPEVGYPKYFNVPSLMQFIFIQEVGRNVDGYRLSTFMYKDRESIDNRLKLGPIWDFNLGFGNVDYCIGPGTEGWAVHFNDFCPSGSYWSVHFWWLRLWNEATFQKELGKYWRELRKTKLSDEHVFHLVDSLQTMLQQPAQRNFQRWPVLDDYVWPNAFVGGTYPAEMQYLRGWLKDRLTWMDKQWEEEVLDTTNPGKDYRIKVTPNPAKESVSIECTYSGNDKVWVDIYNAQGQLLRHQMAEDAGPGGMKRATWDEIVPAGLYFYQLRFGKEIAAEGKIVRF
jgi:hypothetical protein